MRVGITGYNGFIGGKLSVYLKDQSPNLNVFHIDPRREEIISDLDVIFHLGFSSPFKYKKRPEFCKENDINVAKKFLNIVRLIVRH